MEQIANLSTGNRCQGSNPCLSANTDVGQTANIDKRLKRHNQGLVPSTKSGTPWELVLQIKVSDRSEAMVLERKIKKRGAKRYLNDS